jgi:hypothetical protein
MIPLIVAVALFATGVCSYAQTKSLSQGTHRIEITLERLEGADWHVVDPGLVFNSGDRVRFRLRANFDGHLYVMNQGTTGQYTLLFPRAETGRENEIKAGKEYLVPAVQALFRIAGPPGYDIVYWLVSPVTLGLGESGGDKSYRPLPPPPDLRKPPHNLMPRCDDSVFRARGICVDSSAGLRGISEKSQLPENLAGIPGATSRELIIMRQEDLSSVSSPVSLQGPVLYEFRLAHR